MFAILITTQNMPKILQDIALNEADLRAINLYLNHHEDWYMVRGYVTRQGSVEPWNVLPAYALKHGYEHDENKIKTDWDQIVRK